MNEIMETTQKTTAVLFDSESFELSMKIGELMAGGVATVPKHLRDNKADCTAIAGQAIRWGMDPFMLAQKTSLINGSLAYEAQLLNAVVSSSTAIDGRFHYEYGGEWKSDKDPTAWIKVGAILRGEKEITWGEPLFVATVITKNSPLWKTAPKQQGAYLALKYWARLYTPAVILGAYTPDEVAVITERDITPVSSIRKPEAAKEKIPEIENKPQAQELSTEWAQFRNKLISCTDIASLKKAAKLIEGAGLSKLERDNLRSCYVDTQERIDTEANK